MPSGRSNTVLAVVLSLLAVGFAAVAIEAPQVFDPLRRRLGTMPRPRGAPDAGLPPAAAPDAGPGEAPGRSAAAETAAETAAAGGGAAAHAAAAPALDAGTRAPAEPARAPPRKKKRR